jgi:D-amino-acid dehydrogenase
VSRRVLVLGAGVVGLSAALLAAREGLEVSVVDDGTEEGGGCSYGNAGLIVPSHVVPLAAPGAVAQALRWVGNPDAPFAFRPRLDRELLGWAFRFWRAATPAHVRRAAPLLRDLHLASRSMYAEWAREWGDDFGFSARGLLVLCRTAHGLAEEARGAETARALGLPVETLGREEVAALEPELQLDVAGAVRYPLDCHVTPDRLMPALRREAERAGVRFAWRTAASGWRASGRRVEAVSTSGGDRTADEFVLAAGAWSSSLARGLGLRLPLEAGRGLSFTLNAPRRLPRHPALLSEARVAVTPLGSALRVGGTLELSGLDRRVGARRARAVVRSLTRYLPDFEEVDFAGLEAWSGLRPCSPDGLPYVGRPACAQNVVVATGHAMMGLSLGPITGRLVTEVLCGRKASIDLALLSPDRYSRGGT